MATQSTQLATELGVGFEPGQHGLPFREHVGADTVADAVEAVGLLVLASPLEQPPLDLQRRRAIAVAQHDRLAQRRVVADLADRRHRVAEQPLVTEFVVFDHREHDRGGSDLEIRGDLAHVRVADDHVETPVLLSVGVRFVAGVDNGSLERGLQADLLLEEVGALAQLVRHVVGWPTGELAAHFAGTAEDLPRDEVRGDLAGHAPEWRLACEQVVLVAAVAVAFAVGVVLVDDDLTAIGQHRAHVLHRRPHDLLSGAIPHERLAGGGDLRRGDLGMGVVDVVAAPRW